MRNSETHHNPVLRFDICLSDVEEIVSLCILGKTVSHNWKWYLVWWSVGVVLFTLTFLRWWTEAYQTTIKSVTQIEFSFPWLYLNLSLEALDWFFTLCSTVISYIFKLCIFYFHLLRHRCLFSPSSVWRNPAGDGGHDTQSWIPWQLPQQQRLHLENLPASWLRWASRGS